MFYGFCHGEDCWWWALEYAKEKVVGVKYALILNIYQALLFINVHRTKNLCFKNAWRAYIFTTNDVLSSFGKVKFNHLSSLQFKNTNKITFYNECWSVIEKTIISDKYSIQRMNNFLMDLSMNENMCGGNCSFKLKFSLNIGKDA